MIDTHAHLSGRWKKDPERIRDKCLRAGVKGVILAASNLEESRENVELGIGFPKFYLAAAGIHPQQTDPENMDSIEKQLRELEEIIIKGGVVAIGETGLDYSPAPEGEKNRSKAEQEKLFRGQIKISVKYGLPLIIHARKAVSETIEILKEYEKAKGVFHCWAGGKKRLKQAVKTGFYFGIDGNVTYEEGLLEVVREIPRERLLLETDSPFLTPVPYRGEENSPAYLAFIGKKIAEIWGVSFEEMERVTEENTGKLFSRLK